MIRPLLSLKRLSFDETGGKVHYKEEGSYSITMEYLEGQDLKSLIRQTGQLAMPTTLSIAKQVCEGLSEAHKLGTVHRDLKPSNIMIDKDGNARIMDFALI